MNPAGVGKHWARWGDAVREGGLEPNQTQGAHDEQDLIEKFIGLMRELAKFPTANEVKFKARTALGFPWHNTFARIGSKQEFAVRIQEHCKEREGYDDIMALCAPFAQTRRMASSRNDAEPQDNFRFVYLMKSGRYYKIGRTGWWRRGGTGWWRRGG